MLRSKRRNVRKRVTQKLIATNLIRVTIQINKISLLTNYKIKIIIEIKTLKMFLTSSKEIENLNNLGIKRIKLIYLDLTTTHHKN